MRNSICPKRFLLLFACLLLFVTPLHAQRDSEWEDGLDRDKAFLSVYVDPYGAGNVTLELGTQVHDREQLKRVVFKAAVRLSIFAAVIAFAIRLSYAGIAYMAVTAFLLAFIDELARALRDKDQVTQVIPKPGSFEAGTYETGSWKNA